jgi:hypothetical protein
VNAAKTRALTFVVAMALSSVACQQSASSPGPPAGVPAEEAGSARRLVWADEFETAGLPDPARWSYDVGGHGWGNKELQFYTRGRLENARVEGGHLVIDARREAWEDNGYTAASGLRRLGLRPEKCASGARLTMAAPARESSGRRTGIKCLAGCSDAGVETVPPPIGTPAAHFSN